MWGSDTSAGTRHTCGTQIYTKAQEEEEEVEEEVVVVVMVTMIMMVIET